MSASPLRIFTTSVNFVLGAGVLGVPHAIASAGLLLSAAALLLVGGLSMLTSSWLLEVSDRANALQNELASSAEGKAVQHADGGSSTLPPAERFVTLKEPLLSKQSSASKLDEYRAAYRSWRTGSASGSSDTQLKKLMPLIVYEEGRHRALLPLQLLPPWVGGASQVDTEADDESGSDWGGSDLVRGARSASCSGATSPSASFDWLPRRSLSGSSSRDSGPAAAPPAVRRVDSFSADLRAALLLLPSVADENEDEESVGYASPRLQTGLPTPSPPPPPLTKPSSKLPSKPPPLPPKRRRGSSRPAPKAPISLPDWSMPADISALEVAQLCTIFLDWRARALWLTSILALHVAAMWACCAVWIASAHAALDSGGAHAHLPAWVSPRVLLLPCAAVLLPLSILGGTEPIQPFLATATLTTLAGMCVLLLWALQARGGEHADYLFGPVANAPAALVYDGSHFGPAFANFLFAYIVQQSVPALIRRAACPAHTRTALVAAIGTCCGLYLILGGAAALLFGAGTQKLITLNFDALRAAPSGAPPAVWARLVARWIMLLPIITTTAAFPLFNQVLAANLEALLPARLRSRRTAASLCAMPPLLLTACVRDTATVFSVCGLAGFAIVWFVPAMLQHAAMRASVRRWGDELGRRTPHTTVMSGPTTVSAVMAVGVVAFGYNVWAVVS